MNPRDEALPVDVAAMRALCDAATPGPWTTHERDHDALITAPPSPGSLTDMRQIVGDCGGFRNWDNDAAFIAEMRTAAPAMLDEIERLRKRCARYDELLSEQGHHTQTAYREMKRAEAERDGLRAAVERVRAVVAAGSSLAAGVLWDHEVEAALADEP